MRADKPATSWSSFRDRLSTKRGPALQTNIMADEVPVIEDSIAQSPSSAEQYPALDLMANWTNEQPSMSQLLDGRSGQEAIDANRQSGDAVN